MTNFKRQQRAKRRAELVESFAIAVIAVALIYIAFTLPLTL